MRAAPALLVAAVSIASCAAPAPQAAAAADSSVAKFSRYAGHAGVLLIREYRGVGQLVPDYGDTVTITAVRIAGAGRPAFALQVQTASILGQELGVIDLDEVQAMDSAVGVMLHSPVAPDTNYVELEFVAHGGVRVGVYRVRSGYVGYIRPTTNPRSMVPLTIQQLTELQGILGRGEATLKSMGA